MPIYYLSEKSETLKSDYIGSYIKLSKVLTSLSYHITGRPMRVTVTCKKLAEVQDLKRMFETKESVEVTVLVSENLFAKLTALYPSEVRVYSRWDILEKLVSERKMNFERGCLSILYTAVDDKSRQGFEDALDKLQKAHSPMHPISKEDIAKFFYVQEVVFPRQVLIAFLLHKRNRWSLLRKCEMSYPSSQVYYVMQNTLETFIDSKGKYYETGQKDWLSGRIPANNLACMKRVFLLGIKDPYVILKLYEGGLPENDSGI